MRTLIPWNPYQELSNWHRDIDDLFRRFISGEEEEGRLAQSLTDWVPAMEVSEADGHYLVRADLPGVDPKDVEISFIDGALSLKGERKKSSEVKKEGYHYSETRYGSFERRLALPKGVDPEKISAKFVNGVLEISIPVPETAKKVPIQIESSGGTAEPKQIKAA